MKRSDIDAAFILEQHAFAKGQYSTWLTHANDVEEFFKSEFNIPKDVADKANAGSPEIVSPARHRAIIEKFMSMLSLQATHTVNVVPLNFDEGELDKTTKVERWIKGYQLGYWLDTHRSPWLDGPYWYHLRGRMCLQSKIDSSYLGTGKLCLRTEALDPNTTFTVWDKDGIVWYTCETYRYARTLRDQIERRRKGEKKNKWRNVDLGDDPNALVCVYEYWDDQYCGAMIGEGDDAQTLYVNDHDYGFVNIAEAHCMSTPLAEKEWASQPVLYLIMESLKGMYRAMSKVATGVDLFYWPKILVQSPSGQAVILDSGAVGVESLIPPDAKVTVFAPTPNDRIIGQLMGWYQSDVQIGGIPDIAWGSEPGNLQSGFAVSQVLGQVMDKIAPHQRALEMGFAWDWSNKLRLIEKYGDLAGAYLGVPVEKQYVQAANSIRSTY